MKSLARFLIESGTMQNPKIMKQTLVKEEHLAIVYQQCSKIMKNAGSNRQYTRDDLVCAGMEALAMAEKTYDPARSIPFEAYAATRVRFALLNEIKLFQRHSYMELKAEYCDTPDSEPLYDVIDRDYFLMKLIDNLPAVEQRMVIGRYGVFGNDELKLRELGDIMSVSHQAVDKRVKHIVAKLGKCA